MFKKFDQNDQKALVLMKLSVARKTRNGIIECYGGKGSMMDHVMSEIWQPGKRDGSSVYILSCPDKVEILIVDDVPCFYNHRGGQYLPTLRILHQYPELLPKQVCDRGAIPYMLKGANMMCAGLTHEKAVLNESIAKDAYVGIYGEGKEHAIAIGKHTLSGREIAATKTMEKAGVGLNMIHYINDGLWDFTTVKKD